MSKVLGWKEGQSRRARTYLRGLAGLLKRLLYSTHAYSWLQYSEGKAKPTSFNLSVKVLIQNNMRSTIGGYLSLVNSHSPKAAQNFSFSDTETETQSVDNSDEDDNSNKVKSKRNEWKFRGQKITRPRPCLSFVHQCFLWLSSVLRKLLTRPFIQKVSHSLYYAQASPCGSLLEHSWKRNFLCLVEKIPFLNVITFIL